MGSKTGVLIPVYGENDSICRVLDGFKKIPQVDLTICLVVDVPQKQTMERIRVSAIGTNRVVHIIKHRHRSGIGRSLREGLGYLQETGHDVVVVMAGNGKDDPSEMEKLLRPVLEGECEYVQGSRYLRGGRPVQTPPTRVIFNRLYPIIWTLVTRKRCTDVTNGYRCYRLRILDDKNVNVDQEWLDGYSFEYYVHYKVLSLGYKWKEIPISKIYAHRTKGGYSKIQPLKDWWPIISPLLLLFLGART